MIKKYYTYFITGILILVLGGSLVRWSWESFTWLEQRYVEHIWMLNLMQNAVRQPPMGMRMATTTTTTLVKK